MSSPPRAPGTRGSSSPRLRNLSMDALKKRALALQPLPSDNVEQLDELLTAMMEERENSSANARFKDGLKALQAIEHVKEYQQKAQKYHYQKQQMEEARGQVAEVEARISQFDQTTKDEEAKIKATINESRDRLLLDCKARADEHERLWASDQQKRRYNRASPQLRSLRFQVQSMLKSGRFKDAELVVSAADDLQAKEQAINAAQMQVDYEKATKLLNEKIQEDLSIFDETAQMQLNNFRKKRSDERLVFQNQMNKVHSRLELAEDVDRLWNSSQKQIFEQQMNEKSPRKKAQTARASASTVASADGPMVLTLPPLSSKRSLIRTTKQAAYA